MILRRERRDRFTIVDNSMIEDKRLSYKAIGLLTYLLSRPDGWAANYRHLSEMHDDGETSVRSGLDELRTCGYLEQRRRKHPTTGQWVWECIIREVAATPADPVSKPVESVDNEDPCGGFPGMGNPGVGNHRNSKDLEAKTEKNPPNPPKTGGRGKRTSSRGAPPEPLTLLERSEDFDRWWNAWPKKDGPHAALRQWRTSLPDLPDIDQILGATHQFLERTRLAHVGDAKDWRYFLPTGAGWLRDGNYRIFDHEAPTTPVTVRTACVGCGVTKPSVETCQGVESGFIDSPKDVAMECLWR